MSDTPKRALDPVTNQPIPDGEKIPAYQSRTVLWLVATLLIMAVKKFFNLDLPEAEANALLESAIVFFGNGMGIYYRIKSTQTIQEGPVTALADMVMEPAGKIATSPFVLLKNLTTKKP